MSDTLHETWQINKPATISDNGVVVSQHYKASEIGAQVLHDGGNAIDAAIATGFALSTVEPWMSGLGGCGCMVVHRASDQTSHSIYFGVQAARSLNPADYPLTGNTASDLFAWPEVKDNRNVYGPYSIAIPGYVAGMHAAHQTFASKPWAELLAPAVASARSGMSVDWYASLKIASVARQLAQFQSSKAIYLPDGFVPIGEWGGALPRVELKRLDDTLDRLAHAGADDFYRGDIAQSLLSDAADAGCKMDGEDLDAYRVIQGDALNGVFAGSTVSAVPGLTAGPTLQHALTALERKHTSRCESTALQYTGYASALTEAWQHRLEHDGHSTDSSIAPSCTTHVSVADRDGNVVSLTQTLLSLFGSSVVFDRTGVLMNNGVMWFDPRPGTPNSLAPGVSPLSNMCPAIVRHGDSVTAVGASGGRRIVSAVTQIVAFLVDQGMRPQEAAHAARIDVSGSSKITLDSRLDAQTQSSLAEHYDTEVAENGVYPALFACPNIASFNANRQHCEGAAYVTSPWASAIAGG